MLLKAFEWIFSHGYDVYHVGLEFSKFVEVDAMPVITLSNDEFTLIGIRLKFYKDNFNYLTYILTIEEEKSNIDNNAPIGQRLEAELENIKIWITINTDSRCYLTIMKEEEFYNYIKENY